jgi:hypothetical protein
MTPDRVEITVDRFVVEGLDGDSARTLGRAFETELGRLFELEGIPAALERGGEQPPINITDFPLSSSTRPNAAGRRLASAVYRELKR